jgi:hypothetical protein
MFIKKLNKLAQLIDEMAILRKRKDFFEAVLDESYNETEVKKELDSFIEMLSDRLSEIKIYKDEDEVLSYSQYIKKNINNEEDYE